jgi:xanthine dehydrogenase small subunit
MRHLQWNAMTLAYQSFDDAPATSHFLAGRPEARLLGGGTLLVRRVNEGDISIGAYVRLLDPRIKRIEVADDTIQLGAGVTMAAIAKAPALAFLAPVAKSIGGPAVRSAATVGGNLFAPSPYGDFAVALLALDAVVSIESPEGRSELGLETFFRSRPQLPAGSIVMSVRFSRPDAGDFRFVKVSRVKPKGASVLSIAAVVATKESRISTARVALGAMAATPVRAHNLERALTGAPLAAAEIARAVAAAASDVSPASDAIASEWYRKAVLPVHLRRLLSAGTS